MTNAAMVSAVRSSFKWTSSDTTITSRAILSKCRAVRNKYVYQKLNRRIGWDSANLFTPLKIEFQEVPLADFCEYQSECTISRSVHKLPKFGEGIFGTASQGMYSLDKKKKFMEVSPSRYQNILALDLPQKVIYYWFFDDYLWTSSPTLEAAILPVFIEGEVPEIFSLDCDTSTSSCPTNPMDLEFRCFGGGMENDIVDAVASFYSNTYKRSEEDISSDDLDETR